jgi:dUTP pyrophosphatase
MKVKIKKLVPEAQIPKYAKNGDAGLDLTATSVKHEDNYIEYGTGLAVEIPEGYVGLLFPRSSVTNKTLMVKNSVGVIDSGYRGEIKVRFQITNNLAVLSLYQIEDKVAQLIIIPYPQIEFEEVSELSNTERGEGGYGSTGK